jgi:hypothetical protein
LEPDSNATADEDATGKKQKSLEGKTNETVHLKKNDQGGTAALTATARASAPHPLRSARPRPIKKNKNTLDSIALIGGGS